MNLFILPPGALVVEILPKKFAKKANVDIYKDAAIAAQLSYARIWQDNDFSGINPHKILSAIFYYKAKLAIKTFLKNSSSSSHFFRKYLQSELTDS